MSTIPDDYTVLWLCAARVGFETARLLLDKGDCKFRTEHIDSDLYFYGRVGRHNIIVLHLPTALSKYEYKAAATPQNGERAIQGMVQDFPKIKAVLVVGVNTSIQSQQSDIQLGDVVITYEISKTTQQQRFESINKSQISSSIFAEYIPTLRGYCHLPDYIQRHEWSRLALHFNDQLVESNAYEQDLQRLVQKRERDGYKGTTLFHYGAVSSSINLNEDHSLQSPLTSHKSVFGFEVKAQNILKQLSWLVIRGIGNQANPHGTSTGWEGYAAVTPSFYARELLRLIPAGAFELQRIQKPSRFFRVGRCFVTRWVEPRSSLLSGQSTADITQKTDLYSGLFTKMRRFIVIREGSHCAWCVPIHTYEGRGVTKADIKLRDHSKIYRIGNPEPEAEFPLRQPICIAIEGESEFHRLHPASLVNFGKIHTIEHDVSVMNIGYVPKSHLARLKIDLYSLEKSALETKYQRLRRDEGPFNIQLEGREKLSIQELDIGANGLVSIAMSGDSNAEILKLHGSYGSLRISIKNRAVLNLDTVAVGGPICLYLSGESKVAIQKLQQYNGPLLVTLLDEADLSVDVAELKGGLATLAISGTSQFIVRTLDGQGEVLNAKAIDRTRLSIGRACFADSQVSINIDGESEYSVEYLQNNQGLFSTKIREQATLHIGKVGLVETIGAISKSSSGGLDYNSDSETVTTESDRVSNTGHV
ncbi:hypothetical protein NPX13_g6895 [Xylaria arbuscula]|uniref:DUF6590 domain-containing protein n=1 Tax=Xylaria arbuscula TaxID=114810 RepID=A0A9W8NB05_9PEZI|nr:hypothetical protein NPX13_g6895 [Xylaria arbuscula]